MGGSKSESEDISTYRSAESWAASNTIHEARATSEPFSSIFRTFAVTVLPSASRSAGTTGYFTGVHTHGSELDAESRRERLERTQVVLLTGLRLGVRSDDRTDLRREVANPDDVVRRNEGLGELDGVEPFQLRVTRQLTSEQIQTVDVDDRCRAGSHIGQSCSLPVSVAVETRSCSRAVPRSGEWARVLPRNLSPAVNARANSGLVVRRPPTALGAQKDGLTVKRINAWLAALLMGLVCLLAPNVAAVADDSIGAPDGVTPTAEPSPPAGSELQYGLRGATSGIDNLGLGLPKLSTRKTLADSSVLKGGSCQYRQSVDNVHFSSTGWAASSHGSWKKYAGTCPSKANVDIYLQAWACTAGGCGFRTVDAQSGDVYAGGGSSGGRVTARENCANSTKVTWRSFVDVDLPGIADPSGYTYSSEVALACYPSS